MNFLNFVVEHKNKSAVASSGDLNIFEQILIASKRAKDLSEAKTPLVYELKNHKHTTAAIYETMNHYIDPIISEKRNQEHLDDEDYDDSDDN